MKTPYKIFFALFVLWFMFQFGAWHGRTTTKLNANIAGTKAEIQHYKLMEAIIQLESSGQPDVWGDGGTSYGLLQFKKSTFNHYKNQYGLAYLQWKNPRHQILLADLMLRDGEHGHWKATYERAKKQVERSN